MNLRSGGVKPGAHWMLGLDAAPARSGRTALASYNDLLNCHPPPPSVAANNLLKKVILVAAGRSVATAGARRSEISGPSDHQTEKSGDLRRDGAAASAGRRLPDSQAIGRAPISEQRLTAEPKRAQRVIANLRADGHSFESTEVRRWTQRNGWSSRAAADLEAIARKRR
jgi:hypothetical protein